VSLVSVFIRLVVLERMAEDQHLCHARHQPSAFSDPFFDLAEG
jgi:hypothetical protein